MAPEHLTSEKMCEYEGVTNRTDTTSATELSDNKKCYIKIILPSQSDDGVVETGREPEINHKVQITKLEPPLNSVTPLSESVSPTPYPNTHVPEEQYVPEAVVVSSVDDSIATSTVQAQAQYQQCQEKLSSVAKSELAIYNRTDIAKHFPIRTQKSPNKPLLLERPKKSNFAGSFVDIGGWQDELKMTHSLTAEDILKKRSKTYPSLHSKSLCKASKLKFEHHEDLTRYIRDYRYTQTAGNMDRRRLWDGSHQNLHYHNGPQRSLGVPGFRVKTTDPVARTFLPNTPRIATNVNLHDGCILCEQEKFRLRNSFPKRVFLSWSQYMTLCKSNTFMMSQAYTGVTAPPPPAHVTPTTPYPSPRSVSAYSPTRPLRLLNQREKASDMDFKYQNLEQRKPRQIVQKRSMPEQNSIVDKTLIVYRLSEKMRQSTSLSKLDQIDTSDN